MVEKMPFGQYRGKSVDRIAVNDYCYLTWLLDEGIKKRSLRERAEYVINKLNNFVPGTECCVEGCNRPGYGLSIVFRKERSSYGLSVSPGFAVCSKDHFEQIPGRHWQARLYPTEFGILESLPHSPQWIREDIGNVLKETAGINTRMGDKNLERVIDELDEK